MSDLYVDLKRRIPVVTDWTDIGTEEMERAQRRLGLSDERLAAQIPVSAKTWVRWKRRGAIPTHYLPRVVPLLGFEMVPLEPIPLPIQTAVEEGFRESVATLVDLTRAIAETSERMEDVLLRIEQAMPLPAATQGPASRRT